MSTLIIGNVAKRAIFRKLLKICLAVSIYRISMMLTSVWLPSRGMLRVLYLENERSYLAITCHSYQFYFVGDFSYTGWAIIHTP